MKPHIIIYLLQSLLELTAAAIAQTAWITVSVVREAWIAKSADYTIQAQ